MGWTSTRGHKSIFSPQVKRAALLGGEDAQTEALLQSFSVFLPYFHRSLHHVAFKWVSEKSCSLPPPGYTADQQHTSHTHTHKYKKNIFILVDHVKTFWLSCKHVAFRKNLCGELRRQQASWVEPQEKWENTTATDLTHTLTHSYVDGLAEDGMTHTFLSSSSVCLSRSHYSVSGLTGGTVKRVRTESGWRNVVIHSIFIQPFLTGRQVTPHCQKSTLSSQNRLLDDEISHFQGTRRERMGILHAPIQQCVTVIKIANMKVQSDTWNPLVKIHN